MSTNFYAKPRVSDQQLKSIHQLLDEGKYLELRHQLKAIDPIHIGKRSCGWTFLFEIHEEHYSANRASLTSFLDKCAIVDEYGGVYTTADFWQEVDTWNEYNYCMGDDGIFQDGLWWTYDSFC